MDAAARGAGGGRHPEPGAARRRGPRQAPPPRKQCGSQRAQTQACMNTEYQDRFLPPRCYTTIVTTSTQKNPYHPLKGTGADVTTFKSYYVTHKWMKNPSKASQPPLAPREQRCSGAPHAHARAAKTQPASREEDYTSVYKNDFQAWKANQRQPYRLHDSLKVNQGLVVPRSVSKGRTHKTSVPVDANCKPEPKEQEPKPFESTTSYRRDYIPHPVQPRKGREKAVNPDKALLSEHTASLGPRLAWHINRELLNEAGKFFQQFKTWSLETKFCGQGRAQVSTPPTDDSTFLSVTHADYTPHRCQRTRPILPSVQSNEKSKEPFAAVTTMKEDYKAWNEPRRLPFVLKDQMEWPKKTSCTEGTAKPAGSCNTEQTPFSLRLKQNSTDAGRSNFDTAEKHQCPPGNGAFSSFGCISSSDDTSRMYWSASFDKGATWPDNNVCDNDVSQPQQIVGYMVSSQS